MAEHNSRYSLAAPRIVIGIAMSLVSASTTAQNEYSLGNGNPTNALSPASNSAPGDFLEDEPIDLFGDSSPSEAPGTVEFSSGEGMGAGLSDDPAAASEGAPILNGKSTLLPVTQKPIPSANAVQKPLPSTNSAQKSTPSSNSVQEPQPPQPILPAQNLAPEVIPPINLASPPPAPPLEAPPLEPIANVPAPSMPPVSEPMPISPPPQAPLASDGSIAPVSAVDPLAPNEFSGVPPLPGSRRNLARGQAPELYQVEVGDTLFDVCSQLIDDGNYWPRLWSINPDIKNPHFIYPGMNLAFYPGDAQNPPYLDVVEEDDMVPVDKGTLQEAELIAQSVDIPILPKTNANVAPAPEEAVEVIGPEGVEADSSLTELFEVGGSTYSDESVKLTIPAFIVAEEIEGLGMVEGGVRGERLSGDGLSIKIIEAKSLAIGSTFTVLRLRGPILNPYDGETVGYRYDFVGNTRITGQAEEDVYVGSIVDSQIGIRPDDIVVNFMSTKRILASQSPGPLSAPINATVVSMGIHSQRFAGEGAMVFLDKGGLPVGSSYPVYQNIFETKFTTSATGLKNIEDPRRGIGTIRIIDSTPMTSVAVVVQSTSEIRIGDRLSNR